MTVVHHGDSCCNGHLKLHVSIMSTYILTRGRFCVRPNPSCVLIKLICLKLDYSMKRHHFNYTPHIDECIITFQALNSTCVGVCLLEATYATRI